MLESERIPVGFRSDSVRFRSDSARIPRSPSSPTGIRLEYVGECKVLVVVVIVVLHAVAVVSVVVVDVDVVDVLLV